MTETTDCDDDFPRPTRKERRGLFPTHEERPRRLLTLAEARTIARDRLAAWKRDHHE